MQKSKTLTENTIRSALQPLVDPYLGQDLNTANVIQEIKISHEGLSNEAIHLKIRLGFPAKYHLNEITEKIQNVLRTSFGVKEVTIDAGWKVHAHVVQKGLKGIPGVKNVIAVASGKGGVGKSTVACNLALALQAEGAKVGILDADIYGPSLPRMLGANEQPAVKDGKRMIPVLCHGLQSISMGYLVEEDTPMVWRGPMVSSALTQFALETAWHDLDYLVVDLPPGTGDIQLTLAQKIPVSGAVIVTTPQDIALLDAKKALNMFRKLNIPVLGVVENMSGHVCTNCGHEDPVFGYEGGLVMAKQYDVNLLGKVPLERRIREQADNGEPIVAAEPDGKIAKIYREMALSLSAKLSLQPRDYQSSFPTVVIQS